MKNPTIKTLGPPKSLAYRPDIDGLRAVAVLGVVFFHAGLGFPGGYVGVDVFFVISGFLITTLLLKDLRAGTFSILDFWERRIRRIIPALTVTVLAVVIAGWLILLPGDYEDLGRQIVSVVACASNFKFWTESGYFDSAAEEIPLLHTWSLSAEEQFYLVIPLFFALLFKLRKTGWLLPLLIVGIVTSFLFSVYGSYFHQSATFYLLPFRAWELGIGSALAFAAPISSHRLAQVVAWLGIAAIFIPFFFYPAGIRFPGFSALPPVAGAALIIWAGMGRTHHLPLRVLSSRPLVFIGLISYSLYLWHWPIFAFQKYLGLSRDMWPVQASLVAAAFVPAWLSLQYIERPFRTRKLVRRRQNVFAAGAVAILCLVGVSLLLLRTGGFQTRLSPSAQHIADGVDDFSYIHELTAADVPNGLIRFGAPGVEPKIFVWGDSHAMAILPGINAATIELGISGLAATSSATAPVVEWLPENEKFKGASGRTFNREVLDHIGILASAEPNILVILAARWGWYLQDPKERSAFGEAMKRTVAHLNERNIQVAILKEVPSFDFVPPRVVAMGSILGKSHTNYFTTVERHDKRTRHQEQLFAELTHFHPTFVDPLPHFADPRGVILPTDPTGSLWRDSHHLSNYGATRLKPTFKLLFQRLRTVAHSQPDNRL